MPKSKLLVVSAIMALLSVPLPPSAQTQDFKWGNVTMGGGGFVSAIITTRAAKNVIYARTDVGGAYRWNEAGKSWVPITDWLGADYMGMFGVDALAIDPSNPSRVYMLAGTTYWNDGKTMILRSDNYGETFDTINVTQHFKTNGNGMGRQNGERLAVDPNNPNILFCGTRSDGLWKSTNRGTTWSKVASAPTLANGLGICLVLFDPNRVSGGATSRIYIGLSRTTDNFYVSEDGGATWSALAFPTLSRSVMPQRAVLTPGGRFLYVATAVYEGPHGNGASRGALLRYDANAKTWSNISPENLISDPPGDGGWGAYLGGVGGVSISATDTNFIVASTVNAWRPQIWDGGAGAPKAWGDKIYASKDGGATWVNVFGGVDDDHNPTGNEKAAVLFKNGFNWIEGESIHWSGSIEIDPFDPKRVFVTSGNGVYMADNFSPGERFRFNFTVRGIEETVPLDLVSIPGGPLITVIMDYDGFVHHDITKPVLGSRHNPRIGNTFGVDFAKLNPKVVVRVGGNDKQEGNEDYRFPLYYSQDTAKVWTKFGTHPGTQTYGGRIAVSSDGRAVVWAPEEKGVLYRTANWGATWTTVAGSFYRKPFPQADPVDPSVFYAFGGGVMRSNDTGKTFVKVTTGAAGPHGNRNFDWTNDMQVTPGVKGHIWITGFAWDGVNGGFLARSTDGGVTFQDVDPAVNPQYTQRVQHSEAIGFGKAAPGQTYPAIYMYGTIGGVKGVWQSVDEAKTWVRVDDAKHTYGALANGNFIRGDMNTFGVVYKSTAGRGIAARMPASWLDNQIVSVRQPVTAARPHSPFVKMSGQVLALTQPGGTALTVCVYDLKGRVKFKRTYSSAAVLRHRDMVRAKGNYIVTVRNAAKETIYNGRMTVSSWK